MNAPLMVQLKREHHAPDGESAARLFQLLSREGDKGRIQEMVESSLVGKILEVKLRELRYAQPNPEQGALERAVGHGHNRIVDKMLQDDPLLDPNGSNSQSLLSFLGHQSDAYANRVIKTLLDHGADINHQAFSNSHGPSWTPFWNAIHDDKIDHAKRLLAHGASMDLPLPHPQQSDYTVLHLAASCGLWETIAWLIDLPGRPPVEDADIKDGLRHRDDRVDPVSYEGVWKDGVAVPLLHLTASGGADDMCLARRFVDWLVDSGEDWNELDHNGETAWQVARRINASMRPVFDEKLAYYQASEMEASTPPSSSPTRRPRM